MWIGRPARRRGDDKQFPLISIQKLRNILRREQPVRQVGSAECRLQVRRVVAHDEQPPARTNRRDQARVHDVALGFGQVDEVRGHQVELRGWRCPGEDVGLLPGDLVRRAFTRRGGSSGSPLQSHR